MAFYPNEKQKKVINYGEGTLLVEAGPGSGKTKTIVERIIHLIEDKNVDPESFLVITFTTKAADNLKNKLREKLSSETVLKMQISTIHSFCLEYLKSKNQSLKLLDDDTSEKKTLFLQKFKKKLGFTDESTILDYQFPAVLNKFGEYTCFNVDSEELISEIQNSREITPKYINFIKSLDYFSKKRIDDHDNPIKKEIKKGNPEYSEKDLYSKSWYNARYLQIAKAYPIYLKLLDDNNYVDYDTLQLKTLKELEKDSDTQFKTIFVDEFQDTDPLQFRIFELLRKKCDYFTAVGDVDQHIYAFRSSFNDFFDELIRLDNLNPESLDINYRSTENIVNLTEEFIKCQRKETSTKHIKSAGKKCNNPNFLIENEDSDEEATQIYEIINYLKDNVIIKDYCDVAVLYRKHGDKTLAKLIEKFESCQNKTKTRVDYSIRGQSDLKDKDEVKSIITILWYISRKTELGYIPSKDEFDENKDTNLKAFCRDNFKPSLDEITKTYLNELQQSFYQNVTDTENEIMNKNYNVDKIHRVKTREDQDTLEKIFKQVKVPEVDINRIAEKDKVFFNTLNELREKIKSKEPPTILNVFYELIDLGGWFNDVENNYNAIANLAVLTQTISNYESFISESDVRGALFFLRSAIENYPSYQKESKGVQLMTIHAAKGLEFPVTIVTSLEKDKFPMIAKDPKREKDHVFPNDTYYTPIECLKYKTILKEDENGEWKPQTITIDEENKLNDEEEDRILYVAMTRAADLLILSTIGEVPNQIERIRECTTPFNFDDLSQVKICEHYACGHKEKPVLNYSKYTKYSSCPFKYDLGYNLGFQLDNRKATNLGTVFHEIMEKINHKLMDNEEINPEDLNQIIHDEYKLMFDIEENPVEFYEFRNKVNEYFEKYAKNKDVVASEYPFEIDMGDYILNGAVDLIYKINDDEIIILDYKYSEYEDYKVKGYKKQSHVYALALRQLDEFKDYKIKKAIIHFVKSDTQYEVDLNDDALNKELEELNKVACKIDKGLYPKKSKDCDNCQYRMICGGI